MIVQRLYELAEREGLLEGRAFSPGTVACVINVLDDSGRCELMDLRHPVDSGKKGKQKLDKGREALLPARPVIWTGNDGPTLEVAGAAIPWKTTDPAAIGDQRPAMFLADRLPRVLPLVNLIPTARAEGYEAQRFTFWRFIEEAAGRTDDEGLHAVAVCGHWLAKHPEIVERFTEQLESLSLGLNDVVSFRWSADDFPLVLERPAVRNWWTAFYDADNYARQVDADRAFCQVTNQDAPVSQSVKTKIKGLMGIGCRADAYLVTGIPAAESYDLGGVGSSAVSEDAIDGFTRALNALVGNSLPTRHNVKTAERVGRTMFTFWTRKDVEENPVLAVFSGDEEQVSRVFTSVARADRETIAVVDPNDFYCLALTGNSARVVVRDYLECPVDLARENVARWFQDLELIERGGDNVTGAIALWKLIAATAREVSEATHDTDTVLLEAALLGPQQRPLPLSILTDCIRRLWVECHRRADNKPDGFQHSRLALMKLFINRDCERNGGTKMSDKLDPGCTAEAYVCGRLLATMEQIQWSALGDVNATIVDRFYTAASTCPNLIFPRLFKSAGQHLHKLKQEKPGVAVNLQKDLEELSSQLTRGDFPSGPLKPQDQGRFALGFYHQRANYRGAALERRRAKAAEEQATVES